MSESFINTLNDMQQKSKEHVSIPPASMYLIFSRPSPPTPPSSPPHRQWLSAALELERLAGKDPVAAAEKEEQMYNRRLLIERARHLRTVRERGDAAEMMFAVRSDLLRNLGNMTASSLHENHLLVPPAIREYIDEARECLKAVTQSPALSLDDRLAFLRETRHAFGRTALVLSGGGSFGSFHLGVVKSLLDAELLPKVLSGSSAGAIVAALICTRTEDELDELFSALPERLQGIDFYSSNSAAQILRHLVLKGTLQDHTVLQERLQRLLGDVTFQEAYARSGRILNVAVSAADTTEPPRLLNYLTAPSVIVWSAVACSSAFPFLFAPQTLLARDARGFVVPFANQSAGEEQRRWRDGSLEEDLPMRGLSEMFNVNYFLVSQCNPYLLPIIAAKASVPRTLGALAEQEFKHRCKQTMELLPRRLGASRLLKLLSQPWEGDVTMVLPVTTLSTLKAVVNLSREDLLRALAEGQRATWAKLSAIAANCDVEVTLDQCLRHVTAAARRARVRMQRRASALALVTQGGGVSGSGMRRGIPSWLHLQSLGIPHADSHDALSSADGDDHHHQGERQPSAGVPGAAYSSPPSPFLQGGLGMHSVRSLNTMQLDLTDTVVPEDSELLVNSRRYDMLGGGKDEDGDGEVLEQAELFDAGPEGTTPRSSADREPRWASRRLSLGCGDDVWRDLFQVVPATASDGLDFIAP